MTGRRAVRLKTARDRVKEAAARMVAITREAETRPSEEDRFDDRLAVFRWCLLVEAVVAAFRSAPPSAGPVKLGGGPAFWWSVVTDTWRADPFFDAVSDPNGAAPPTASLRGRIGSAAAEMIAVLDEEAGSGAGRRVPHAAFGPLAAPRWAELLLIRAAALERERLARTAGR